MHSTIWMVLRWPGSSQKVVLCHGQWADLCAGFRKTLHAVSLLWPEFREVVSQSARAWEGKRSCVSQISNSKLDCNLHRDEHGLFISSCIHPQFSVRCAGIWLLYETLFLPGIIRTAYTTVLARVALWRELCMGSFVFHIGKIAMPILWHGHILLFDGSHNGCSSLFPPMPRLHKVLAVPHQSAAVFHASGRWLW